MATLNKQARATLRDEGLSPSAWARLQGYETGWGGDACGCPDPRCIGHHHDAEQDCGCLAALLPAP